MVVQIGTDWIMNIKYVLDWINDIQWLKISFSGYKGLIMKGYKLFTHTVVPLTRFADEMHTPYNAPSRTSSVN